MPVFPPTLHLPAQTCVIPLRWCMCRLEGVVGSGLMQMRMRGECKHFRDGLLPAVFYTRLHEA